MTSNTTNPQYGTVMRMLSEICMLAAQQNSVDASKKIRLGIETVLSDSAPFRISLAMTLLGNDLFEDAQALVQAVLDEDEENLYAKAVLGFVLQVAGYDGWREHYETVLSQSTDPEARKLAQQGLLLN